MQSIVNEQNHYHVYRTAIQKLINGEEQLPSLPSVTLKIRQAIRKSDADMHKIAKWIRLDPSLSTLLLKQASSPIYAREVPPKTIEAILNMIGFQALDRLVMVHSIKSLFVMKNSRLKNLFRLAWERMIYKAATSQLLAYKVGFRPSEEAMTASILSEVGTLALLSAFNLGVPVPDKQTYYQLCKQYSKSLSTILLRKWGLEEYLIKITESSGHWGFTDTWEVTMTDIINLAIYSTVQHQSPTNDLPPIEELASYKKLPASLNAITEHNELVIVQDNLQLIDRIMAGIR